MIADHGKRNISSNSSGSQKEAPSSRRRSPTRRKRDGKNAQHRVELKAILQDQAERAQAEADALAEFTNNQAKLEEFDAAYDAAVAKGRASVYWEREQRIPELLRGAHALIRARADDVRAAEEEAARIAALPPPQPEPGGYYVKTYRPLPHDPECDQDGWGPVDSPTPTDPASDDESASPVVGAHYPSPPMPERDHALVLTGHVRPSLWVRTCALAANVAGSVAATAARVADALPVPRFVRDGASAVVNDSIEVLARAETIAKIGNLIQDVRERHANADTTQARIASELVNYMLPRGEPIEDDLYWLVQNGVFGVPRTYADLVRIGADEARALTWLAACAAARALAQAPPGSPGAGPHLFHRRAAAALEDLRVPAHDAAALLTRMGPIWNMRTVAHAEAFENKLLARRLLGTVPGGH